MVGSFKDKRVSLLKTNIVSQEVTRIYIKFKKITETIKDNKVSYTRNLFEQEEEEKDYYKAGKVDKVIK